MLPVTQRNNLARHQNPVYDDAARRRARMGQPRTSLAARPAAVRNPPPVRACRPGARQCAYMCRDTNKQCELCTRNTSGFCWQHSLNPSMKQASMDGRIVGNVKAQEELGLGRIAPHQRNPDVLNDEVFISLCLRKIKDQCRHIQLPCFSDPGRVRVDASKFDPGRDDWLPFVCYVRRVIGGGNQMHLVMTNFFSVDNAAPGINIVVWSPQLSILDCVGDTYLGDGYVDKLNILAEELDVSRDGNMTQIFNCNIGNNAAYLFTPVVPLYTLNREQWDSWREQPFDLDSAFALQCIAMVKHIVLEIQKHQRLRNSGRFPNPPMPPATQLVPIVFTNFTRLFHELGYSLGQNGRFEFDDALLRQSRYQYGANRAERKSYRITITEVNAFDLLGRIVVADAPFAEYLENVRAWVLQAQNMYHLPTVRERGQFRRIAQERTKLIQSWGLICADLSQLLGPISNELFMSGTFTDNSVPLLDDYANQLFLLQLLQNENLQQELARRQGARVTAPPGAARRLATNYARRLLKRLRAPKRNRRNAPARNTAARNTAARNTAARIGKKKKSRPKASQPFTHSSNPGTSRQLAGPSPSQSTDDSVDYIQQYNARNRFSADDLDVLNSVLDEQSDSN